MKKSTVLLSLLFLIFSCASARAGEVYLANGDKITGDVVFEDEEKVIVSTESMGELSIKRSFIHHVVKVVPKAPPPASEPEPKPEAAQKAKQLPQRPWKGEISPGYTRRSGNTNSSDLYLNAKLTKKTKVDEAEVRADSFYSTQEHRMVGQRYYGLGRYAVNFGDENKWNVFGKLEGDHDRFANIRIRTTPSAGIGYKFSDKPDWKALAELGAGATYTDYLDRTPDKTDPVLVPRLFLERKIFERLRASQDLTFYVSVGESQVRLRSETSLINAITQKISVRLRLIDDYNSDPGLEGVKKNDVRLVSSLVYSF